MAQQTTSYKLIPKLYSLADIDRFTKDGDWPVSSVTMEKRQPANSLAINTIRYGTDNFSFGVWDVPE